MLLTAKQYLFVSDLGVSLLVRENERTERKGRREECLVKQIVYQARFVDMCSLCPSCGRERNREMGRSKLGQRLCWVETSSTAGCNQLYVSVSSGRGEGG